MHGATTKIKIDLQEVWRDMDWIDPGRDREDCRHLLNVLMNLQVASYGVTGISSLI